MPSREQRTTVGTPAPAGYDQSLIAQAPAISKADRQEGYDINLLEKGHTTPQHPPSRPRTVPPPAVPPTSSSHPSLVDGPVDAANGYSKNVTKSRSTPWYRTTKGLVIAIVAALVLVGVIVGVAVGVTQNKKNTPEQKEKASQGGALGDQPNASVATPTSSHTGSISSGETGETRVVDGGSTSSRASTPTPTGSQAGNQSGSQGGSQGAPGNVLPTTTPGGVPLTSAPKTRR